MRTPDQILAAAAATYKERIAVYGANNGERVGMVMAAMFPTGITLTTAEDFTRLYLYMMTMAKAGRYAHNFHNGGHADSLTDQSVFAAMLQSVDEKSALTKLDEEKMDCYQYGKGAKL